MTATSVAAAAAVDTATEPDPTHRASVLSEIRSGVVAAHKLILASRYDEAVSAYQALRATIFRIIGRGGTQAPSTVRWTAPHDLSHLASLVEAGEAVLARQVTQSPATPVADAGGQPKAGSSGTGGAAPRTGDGKAAVRPRLSGLLSPIRMFQAGTEVRTAETAVATPMPLTSPSRAQRLDSAALLKTAYEPRLRATVATDLLVNLISDADASTWLAHLYYYVIPVALAEAHAGLGQWNDARTWLYRAADYPYLNKALEAPALWARIAETHAGEGDALYRLDEFTRAASAYGGIVGLDGSKGTARAYTHAALGDVGVKVAELLAAPATVPVGLDLGLAATVLDVVARVRQLAHNLDWYGLPASYTPPFTFDHLQNAGRFLAQQAKAAERDFMQFMERYDTGRITRLQLDQAAAAAKADAAVAAQQYAAATAEVNLANKAKALATQRKNDAVAERAEFAEMSTEQIGLESDIAWYSSQNSWELGNPIPGDGREIHEVIAADRARLGEISQAYELERMAHSITELGLAEQQAAAQVALSQARSEAAWLAEKAAVLRQLQAKTLAAAYEQSFFTPEVWKNLANFMRGQVQRYLHWATRVARMMERAYEFENDVTVDRIRVDYTVGVVAGLLGADQLLADIDYFTYHRLTTTTHKTLRGSLSVSLAQRFPFAFQTQFRRTGAMTFTTLLADVERDFPGSFNHRIQAVEVEVVGLVPADGLRGTLSNGGVSQYRSVAGTSKWRLQDVDTMLLTAYSRNDAPLFRPRPELLNVFEGVGLASTWTLRYPANVNDIDFRFVVDVRLVFLFEAMFDRTLAAQVQAQPTPPDALRATASFSLRSDFPDRFFLYTSQGSATLTVGPDHLPHHHLEPKVRAVSLQLLGDGGPAPATPLNLAAPGVPGAEVTPDADGRVPSGTPALGPLVGAPVLGDWTLATSASPADRDRVFDVLLFIEYDFTERSAQ